MPGPWRVYLFVLGVAPHWRLKLSWGSDSSAETMEGGGRRAPRTASSWEGLAGERPGGGALKVRPGAGSWVVAQEGREGPVRQAREPRPGVGVGGGLQGA